MSNLEKNKCVTCYYIDDGFVEPISTVDIIGGVKEMKVKVCRRNPLPIIVDNMYTHWCGEHLLSAKEND